MASRAEPAENNPWFRCRACELGLEVVSAGVRAYIPPGGMGAKKATEAAPIARREATAAMPSQANTATRRPSLAWATP